MIELLPSHTENTWFVQWQTDSGVHFRLELSNSWCLLFNDSSWKEDSRRQKL